MGLGADMSVWAEDNGYEGDDPWGAWVEDLQYRAFGKFSFEELERTHGLKWNQKKRQWLQSDSSKKKNSSKKKTKVVRTSTHATCSSCQQQKPKFNFSKRQWKTKGAQARCVSCINAK
mmetsp:Transcript_42302/g.43081  ORF Transcript_42302/g.43081 Transcript_42302/m.43081 type:complete len:118 (+) Transcript_42302:146-499(+)